MFRVGDYIKVYNPYTERTLIGRVQCVNGEWYLFILSNGSILWASENTRDISEATRDEIMMHMLES